MLNLRYISTIIALQRQTSSSGAAVLSWAQKALSERLYLGASFRLRLRSSEAASILSGTLEGLKHACQRLLSGVDATVEH